MLPDANISPSLDPGVRFHHPLQRLLVICLFHVWIDHLWLLHVLHKRLDKLILYFIRDVQCKVQVRRFFELPFPNVTALAVVLRSCNPRNSVIVVEIKALLLLLLT